MTDTDKATGRLRILDAIAESGPDGRTDDELATICELQRWVAGTRRGDLVKTGWVKRSGKKRPSAAGNPAAVWVMTPEGMEAWQAGEKTTLPDEEIPEDELLRKKSPGARKLYGLIGENGKMTDMQMRSALNSAGSGPRGALQSLLDSGIVRPAGKANTRGKAQQYEQTPRQAREIAAQREKWRTQKPVARPSSHTFASARLQQLRRMTDVPFSEWADIRKHILSETILLTRLEPAVFSNDLPEDELEAVVEEVAELRHWVERASEAIELRLSDDAIKRKITKMQENVNGRTEAEIETAKGRIAVLKAKL